MSDSKIPGLGFLLGGTAACMAVTFTNPWEVVKTRLQLQGELQSRNAIPSSKKTYRGVSHAFLRIATVEGVRGLQKGLVPAYFYQLVMNGVRFGGYEQIKTQYTRLLAPDLYRDGKPHHFSNILGGATSGVLGAALGSPFFLVKTRLQSYSPHMAVGAQHSYSGMFDAFRSIYRKDGFRGLITGAHAAMLRTGVGSAVQLSTYEKARNYYIQTGHVTDSIAADFAASLTSGFFVCVFMNPFDTISTRLYNQNIDHATHRGTMYSGPLDCFIKTLRAEGMGGLYKGFMAHYFRIGPHTVLCFIFLEQLRRGARANNWL